MVSSVWEMRLTFNRYFSELQDKFVEDEEAGMFLLGAPMVYCLSGVAGWDEDATVVVK